MKKHNFNKAFNVAMATTLVVGAVVAVAPTQAGAALSFSDVKETNSHYANILNLAERGIILGYEDGKFRPGDAIKRGNAAKIIAGVLGLNTTNVTNPGFKDVSTKNANYGAIAALANAGIISGFKEDGTYRPNATLTRGQMAKIIANAFELSANGEKSPFTDVQNSQYKENIAALFANGVTTGVTATTFDAKSNVTRGQLASFVVRAENVQKSVVNKEGILEESKVISAIRDSKVIVGNQELTIAEELKAVFSVANASALEGAQVELEIEYTADTVASLVPVFAKAKGKIVGIKGLKLVKADTTFNPKGFSIPKISIGAAGVKLQEVKTSVLEVAKDSSVSIENVELTQLTLAEGAEADIKNSKVTSLDIAAGAELKAENLNIADLKLATGSKIDLTDSNVSSLQIAGDAKVTMDSTTTFEKVNVEEGKTLADVISNYEEVKESLKDVIVEEKASEVNPGETTPGTGTVEPTTEPTIEKLDKKLTELQWTHSEIADYSFTKSSRTIDLTIKGSTATVGEVKGLLFGLKDNFKNIGLSTLTLTVNGVDVSNKTSLKDFSDSELLKLAGALTSLDEDFVDMLVDNRNNNSAEINKEDFNGSITFKVGSTTYKVNFK